MSLKHAGDVPSVNVYHETRIPERIVKLGCNINLHKNSPKVSSVIWTKDGKKIDICGSRGKYTGGSIADPSLTINAVNSTDKGEYKCCVSNSVGHNWSESILLGPPTVELDNPKIDRTRGTATYIATISSFPSAMEAEWKVKEGPTGNYKTIDISDPFYGGSTVSMPHPKLIRHGYITDHLESYELEVSNFIGRSRRNTEDVTKNISHSNIERGILSDSGLMYVATRLGAEWSLVAVSLGLKQAEIDQIKLDNPYSTQTQSSTVLRQWRDRRGDQTNNTLMQQLFDTLKTFDRTDLVEELREKYDIPGMPDFGSKVGCISIASSGSKFTPGTSDDSVNPSGFNFRRRQGDSTARKSRFAFGESEPKSNRAQQDLQLKKVKINPKIRDFSLEKLRTNLTHLDLEKMKTNRNLDSHLGKSKDKSKTQGFAFAKSGTIDTSSSAGFKFESGNELSLVSSDFSVWNNDETSSPPTPDFSFGPGNGSTTADGTKRFLFAPSIIRASLFGSGLYRRPAQADAIGVCTQGKFFFLHRIVHILK